MVEKPKRSGGRTELSAKEIREQRLKAALKANMGRRKAQARARTASATDKPDADGAGTE